MNEVASSQIPFTSHHMTEAKDPKNNVVERKTLKDGSYLQLMQMEEGIRNNLYIILLAGNGPGYSIFAGTESDDITPGECRKYYADISEGEEEFIELSEKVRNKILQTLEKTD